MDTGTFLAVISLVFTAIGLLWMFFKEIGDLRKENAKNKDELKTLIAELSKNVSEIRVKTDLFWKLVEENVSGILKQPIHLEKDALIDKLRKNEITRDEARRLCEILSNELDALPEKSTERIGYTLVLASIRFRHFPEECVKNVDLGSKHTGSDIYSSDPARGHNPI